MSKVKAKADVEVEAEKTKAEAEATYTIGELAEAARQEFGCNPDIVYAALRGINRYTVESARKKVKEFMKKEAK